MAQDNKPESVVCKLAQCDVCQKIGCCRACAYGYGFGLEQSALAGTNSNSPNTPELFRLRRDSPYDIITYWCSQDYRKSSEAARRGEKPEPVRKRRVKVGKPLFPDGAPCSNWTPKFYTDELTRKVEIKFTMR